MSGPKIVRLNYSVFIRWMSKIWTNTLHLQNAPKIPRSLSFLLSVPGYIPILFLLMFRWFKIKCPMLLRFVNLLHSTCFGGWTILCFVSLASESRPDAVVVQSNGRSSFSQTAAVRHLTGSVTRPHGLRFVVVCSTWIY